MTSGVNCTPCASEGSAPTPPPKAERPAGSVVGRAELVAVSEEAQTGSPLQKGPLVTRQMDVVQVMNQVRAQSLFIMDLFDVHLS